MQSEGKSSPSTRAPTELLARVEGAAGGQPTPTVDLRTWKCGQCRLPVLIDHIDRVIAYGFFPVRMGALSAATFGLLGLTPAVIGVYGVVSYATSLRTHEICVRLALGATPRDVLRLVVQDGFKMVLLRLAAGSFMALASSRVLETFLFGVSAYDAVTFAGVASTLTCVAFLASAIPA